MVSVFGLCLNQNKEYNKDTFHNDSQTMESTIDFNLIDQLYQSNQKAIKIASYIFSHTSELKTLQQLIKIKKSQKTIETELNKLSEKNLILIPKSVYQSNPISNETSLQNFNTPFFSGLKAEINTQIKLFDSIKGTSKNSDFKQFAIRSLAKLNKNRQALQVLFPTEEYQEQTKTAP